MKRGELEPFSLPFEVVETACRICGRLILKPKKRCGRHSRLCSPACWREAKREAQKRWNNANQDHVREYHRQRWTRLKAAKEKQQ